MATKEGQTVFVEYSTAEKNQHMMTVMYTLDHKRVINGRIFKDYDREKGKTSYRAVDWEGNNIFLDTHDLPSLKKKFVENGKTLAMNVPKTMKPAYQKDSSKLKNNRQDELKNTRSNKGRSKAVEKNNTRTAQKPELEKQTKGQPQSPSHEPRERDQQLNEIRHPDYHNEIENESEERSAEMSERDMELEDIRDHDTEFERDEDQQVDMDL